MPLEALQIRIHGRPDQPTLVYLPGLHGDWTLIGSFRSALESRVRFIEFTYPRTLTWSLDDYAREMEQALIQHGISRAWLLAESFGSQVAWPLAASRGLKFEGIILAGGFGRHPAPWGVRMAQRMTGRVSPALLARLARLYSRIAKVRYRRAPEVLRNMQEFLSRRTDLDRQAAQHRLGLILANDPCQLAGSVTAPVYAMTGVLDPIVPWWPVRRWLRRYCPDLREHKIILRADHQVLVTAPRAAAALVLRWMFGERE